MVTHSTLLKGQYNVARQQTDSVLCEKDVLKKG